MGFVQNLTLASAPLEVTRLQSTPYLSSAAVNNSIIVLGVLTFALQLCLVLFLMLRCWRSDNRVQQTVTHPDAAKKLIAPPTFYSCDVVTSSTAVGDYEFSTTSEFAPSIPWDLVQG